MTPRPQHVRDRMVTKIAEQVVALPMSGCWQVEDHLAKLLDTDLLGVANLVLCRLRQIGYLTEVKVVRHGGFSREMKLVPMVTLYKPRKGE